MSKRTLLIKIVRDQIFFNPGFFLPVSQTNLPEAAFTFKPHVEFYWLVEMEKYDPVTRNLWVQVVDYQAGLISEFHSQVPKNELISLEFAPLDWKFLEPQLSYYARKELAPFLKNMPAEGPPKSEEKVDAGPDPKRFRLQVKFEVAFADVCFHLGYVSFKKTVKGFDEPVDFKILNDFLLPEFEYIKFWFAKKLNTRKIRVQAALELLNGVIQDVQAESKEISSISADLIDLVRQQRTFRLLETPRYHQPDKSLFTPEDIFDQFEEDHALQGNVFRQSERNILEALLENKNIRNRQQLVYLAGLKQSATHKLRFTLAPHFGFLFLVEGEQGHHFIWELLNSHATYIWSIAKNERALQLQYKRVEQTINTIRSTGRDAYRAAYKANHLDQDLHFTSVEHTHAGSALVDGFPRWKHRLNEVLV